MCIAITDYHTKCSRTNHKLSSDFCYQHYIISEKRKMKNIYDDFYIVDYLCQDEESLMPGTVFFNSEYTHNVKIKYAISHDTHLTIIICQLSMSNHDIPKIDEIFIRYFLVHIITWIVAELTQADATIPQGLRPKK